MLYPIDMPKRSFRVIKHPANRICLPEAKMNAKYLPMVLLAQKERYVRQIAAPCLWRLLRPGYVSLLRRTSTKVSESALIPQGQIF